MTTMDEEMDDGIELEKRSQTDPEVIMKTTTIIANSLSRDEQATKEATHPRPIEEDTSGQSCACPISLSVGIPADGDGLDDGQKVSCHFYVFV